MLTHKIRNDAIIDYIYIPKYYDPNIQEELSCYSKTHDLLRLGDLIDDGTVIVQTGHEIGKMAYGTGSIPFVRTSDISNWEIKTIPKQGVSKEIYNQYADKEDVQPHDILMVRDGSYLIGTNCMITEMDIPMLFQSHILKFRVVDSSKINPYILFLAFNSSVVQRQIRNKQFTSDIIDTIGNRFRELILPIPKSDKRKSSLTNRLKALMDLRVKDKAAIRQMPLLMENIIEHGTRDEFSAFFSMGIEDIIKSLVQDTTTTEYGEFSAFTVSISNIKNSIYIPKYYDPSIQKKLKTLKKACDLVSIEQLVTDEIIKMDTGDEIGKMAYGTGEIPFVRTSDFSNWEIKTDAKQGVSEEIFDQYATKEDIQIDDILLVRDGTYLIGTTCIVTKSDVKMLYCGGLIKIRCLKKDVLDPFLLLGLLNSYIVKRQIRTKEFTRDVINTLGQRLNEVILPLPKSNKIRKAISTEIKKIVDGRVGARDSIKKLSDELLNSV